MHQEETETEPLPSIASTPGGDPFAPSAVVFQSVSAGLATARLVVSALWIAPPLLGAIALAVFVTPWLWFLAGVLVIIAAWLGWLIPRQVRAMGYAERDEDFLVRKGILFRQLTVVPYGRMQYVDVQEGPIMRRLHLATVQLQTASAATDATVPGLPRQEASRLRDQLTERGEAKLEGL
ncbi:MAG: PH domain-containing protein [Arachnia sp.]